MKLPNGYGSVYKLAGNRRKPWVARKTTGYKENKHPVYVFVGYYETRKDALQALAEYNGYQLSASPRETSLRLVYKALQGLTAHYTGTWKHLEPLYDVPMSDLTLSRIQAVFDRCGKPLTTQKYMRQLLSKCFDYAVKHEYVRPEKANIVQWIEIKAEPSRTVKRSVFTDDEIKALWQESDPYAQLPLILIYSGLRIDELLSLRPCDVDTCFHVRKSKTPSGVRDVPVIDKIKPLVDYWKAQDAPTLICTPHGVPMTYDNLRFKGGYWKSPHLPHDCRHTCATRLAEAGVDRRVINAILGHKGTDVAESVYTHMTYAILKEALEIIAK